MEIEEHINNALTNDPKRTTINLSNSGIGDDDIDLLVGVLNKYPKISKLTITHNNINNLGVEKLTKLQYIKKIDLSSNDFDTDGALLFLKTCQCLEVDLTRNYLSDDIINAIKENKDLQKIVVKRAYVSDKVKDEIQHIMEERANTKSANPSKLCDVLPGFFNQFSTRQSKGLRNNPDITTPKNLLPKHQVS